jgi:CMP-N,N'-diacetyllegionaminic acid synthase
MTVLAIIPARGGSKGIPRKNVRLLGGKPLLAYTAEAALAARSLERIILSTEDEEIAAVGRACGLEVPFLRPPELAQDTTPTLPVLQHAVAWLEQRGARFDAVCLLQPTNPFRRPEDIDGCIRLLETSQADSVISVLPVPDSYNPYWVYLLASDGILRLSTGEAAPIPRRQELPAAYHRDGAVYVTRRDVLVEGGTLYGARVVGYPMDPARSVNLDSPEDWLEAERLLANTVPHVRN